MIRKRQTEFGGGTVFKEEKNQKLKIQHGYEPGMFEEKKLRVSTSYFY
jgi:hypothetical protein